MKNIYKTVNSKLFLLFLVMFLSNLGYGQELNELDGNVKQLVITPKQEPIQLKEVVIKTAPAKPLNSYGLVNLAGATMSTGSSIMDMSTGNGGSGSSNGTLESETNTGVSPFEQYIIQYLRSIRNQEENQYPSGVDAIPEIVVTKPPVQNPKADLDPCAEIKKQIADANYKAMMAELESPATLNKHNETGYWQDNKGIYHPMEINGSRAVKMPADMSTMENMNHVHMNNWVDPVTGPVNSYPMPSPADIAKVYALGYNSLSNGLNLANSYVGNTSYLGSFQMRFVGNPDSLSAANFVKIYDTIMSDTNKDAYELAMKQNDKGIEGLLAFLRDALKTTDIAVYKIEATGASKVELDANNQITKTPCN